MNYLAHLYLAGPTPESLLGNLVADCFKGNRFGDLPEGIQHGIKLHRKVDAFTDYHPLVQRSIGRIAYNWGWFSGILVDVYYDHILATTWDRYSSEPLRIYLQRIQQSLCEHVFLVPSCQAMIAGLIENDRLFSYSTPKGIEEALAWISFRIEERMPGRAIHLENAMPELRANHAGLETDFHEFFPSLIALVRDRKE